ncbi:hypothetical protein NDU88_000411 [Pleurodeles waltl]|uniref:Uncharacterized protein n=1 Tax=Pleurodeles waltl TaxID=8319 RepID=A0AAV7UPW4_PLEWA|nr:hypothetical protein NDU88_000411 [Pleurodeles waltl]
MKRGIDVLEGLSTPSEHQEGEPDMEGDAQWEPRRNPAGEPSQRPQEGSALRTDGEDKEGRERSLSGCREAGAETDVGEDKEVWFEDWWMPPVKVLELDNSGGLWLTQ